MERSGEVLQYWFGEPATEIAALRAKVARWFVGGAELDREIVARFGSLVEDALAGRLDAWGATARSRLALILLLDQFTRSVYRDQPQMYAGDATAQALAIEALDAGAAAELGVEERLFLHMPLLHAETLALQDRMRVEAERLVAEAPAWSQPVFAMSVEQAGKYRDVIARFGRFPHRNAILGRPSTAAEEAFLADWKERQAPSGLPPKA
ncbi:MAG: DUF924 domain-containing protein [Myxococcota bacterium]|nr:DUF924 domain-containing protein [Myxococcota bacterium]